MDDAVSAETVNDRELAKRAYIARLTLLDDLFMGLVFEDRRCIELVLRIILGIDDLCVEENQVKHTMANLVGRSAQIDVLAVEGRGRRYDIEVQRDPRGAIPRRARYYGALLDAEALEKNHFFDELPEAYVIFITESDALEGGEKIYHIERTVMETRKAFGDGLHVIYVNCACPDDGTPLGDLAHDFRCADPARMRYNVLKRKTSVLKDGEKAPIMSESIDRLVEEFKGFWIEDGLAEGRQRGLEEGLAQGREEGLERGREEGLEEGRQEGLERGRLEGLEAGRQQGFEEAARGLLRQGSFSPDDIAGLTGLPVERVRELASLP